MFESGCGFVKPSTQWTLVWEVTAQEVTVPDSLTHENKFVSELAPTQRRINC
jgi:hypothetical protein